jgi:hypothetical protein
MKEKTKVLIARWGMLLFVAVFWTAVFLVCK